MILTDKELNKQLKELADILLPKQIQKIQSHLVSLNQKIEDLRKSRDNWKARALGGKR